MRHLLFVHLPLETEEADATGSDDNYVVPGDVTMGEASGSGSVQTTADRWKFLKETLKVPETWIHEAKVRI